MQTSLSLAIPTLLSWIADDHPHAQQLWPFPACGASQEHLLPYLAPGKVHSPPEAATYLGSRHPQARVPKSLPRAASAPSALHTAAEATSPQHSWGASLEGKGRGSHTGHWGCSPTGRRTAHRASSQKSSRAKHPLLLSLVWCWLGWPVPSWPQQLHLKWEAVGHTWWRGGGGKVRGPLGNQALWPGPPGSPR